MIINISKDGWGNKCKVSLDQEAFYPLRTMVDVVYNHSSNTVSVDFSTRIAGHKSATEPLANVTIQDVVITDTTVLETQLKLFYA